MKTSLLAWRQATVLACLLPILRLIAPLPACGEEPLLRTFSVPESSGPGVIGRLDLPNADQITAIRLITNGPCVVAAKSLEVSLLPGVMLDFESQSVISQQLDVTYRVAKDDVNKAFEEYLSQAGGTVADQVETLHVTLQLSVTDVQEPPQAQRLACSVIQGRESTGSIPFSWLTIDPEGDSLTFELLGPTEPLSIDERTGAISLEREPENAEVVPVRIRISDQHGGTAELTQTVLLWPRAQPSVPAQQPDVAHTILANPQTHLAQPPTAPEPHVDQDSVAETLTATVPVESAPQSLGLDRNSTLNSQWIVVLISPLFAMLIGCIALMLAIRWGINRFAAKQAPAMRISPEAELSQADLEELLWSQGPTDAPEPHRYDCEYSEADDDIAAASRQHAFGLLGHDYSSELNAEWRASPKLAVCHSFEIDAEEFASDSDDRAIEYAVDRAVDYAAQEQESDEFARELDELDELDEHRTLHGFRLSENNDQTTSAADENDQSTASSVDELVAYANSSAQDVASESAIEEWLRRVAPGFESPSSSSFRLSSNSFNLSSQTFGLLDEIEEAQVAEQPRERVLPEGYREHLRNELESFRKLAISAAEIRMLEEEQEEQTKAWTPAAIAVVACGLTGLVCIWFNWFGMTAPLLGWPLIGVGAVILTRNIGSWLPLWLRLRRRSLSVREYLEDPRR